MASFPSTIAGLPAKETRDLLRFAGETFYAQRIALKCDWPLPRAQALMAALESAGYVRRREVDQEGDILWERSDLGQRLVCARFLPRLRRATAETLLDGVVERARSLNRDPGTLYFIARLSVFGSYLDAEAATLGDLDVGVVLQQRRGLEARDFAGMRPWDFPELRHLRNGSGYIALHQDAETLGTPLRMVLTATAADVPPFDRERARRRERGRAAGWVR
jgi:hypothetical protein